MRSDPIKPWRFRACRFYSSVGLSLFLIVSTNRLCAEVNSNALVNEAEALVVSVRVEQPSRAFGYVLGDVLIQRVLLPASTDRASLLKRLPAIERIGQWLERQAVTIQPDKDNRLWLRLRFQVINSPTDLITANLPAIHLVVNENGRSDTDATLRIDAWPFTLGPLTPEVVAGTGDLLALRPDRQPVALDTADSVSRIQIIGMALAVVLLSWLAWWLWRQRRDATRLPFAIALQTIKKMGGRKADEHPDAWMAMHHAFNSVAGQTVHAGSVGDLMKRQRWLQVLNQPIEQFYTASAARFFEHPPRSQAFELHVFSQQLCRAEKRNAE